jgi:hypothetical protein
MVTVSKQGESKMTNTTENGTKATKKPNYVAYSVHSQGGAAGPKYTRIGVGFTYRNGSIGVMYDAIPLSGQIVLLGIDQEEKPTAVSYGHPTRKADFEACMVREAGQNSFWTPIGSAWRQDGYISIQLDAVVPLSKLVLSVPKENA